MLKKWLLPVCIAAVGLVATSADDLDARANSIVENFTENQVVGQLAQIAVFALLNEDYSLNEDLVRYYAKRHVGSFLTTPFTNGPNELTFAVGWNVAEWRNIITRIQEIVMEENDGIPMIFGIDSVHGAGFVLNTTLFGAQINGAATFNPDLVYEMGRVTGQDTQAAGIPSIFCPILEISSNPLWARTYETFGEDPHLVSVMGDAVIRGLQSNNQTAACMKHFVGYSKTPTGHDKDGVEISDFDLLNYFVKPFKEAIDAGVMTTMENYISINGVPTIGNHKILQQLLREDLALTDLPSQTLAKLGSLNSYHRVARTGDEAVRMSYVHTGIDMSMGFNDAYLNSTLLLLEESPEYFNRLKDSAKRIIKTKLQLGLFDTPIPGADDVAKVRNDVDVEKSLEMARESIVLLQNNDNTLPISSSSSVFLTGHSAHNIGNQCGGWSVRWPGYTGNDLFPNGISVKEGLEAIVGDKVTYFNGLEFDGNYTAANLTTAKQHASKAEYTVAVIGELPYAEKTGDINDLALPAGQIEYVKELASTGTKVIVVLFEGRPRLLGDLSENVHAVVHGLLACEQGGKVMAEIIYGQVSPSGRMRITYPKDAGNWDFGTGLSYTEFSYSDLTLSKTNVTSSSDSIDVTVTVTNSGSMAGKETVMLFLTQPYRSISVPEVKQLKKFSKISLEPAQSQTVSFTLTADDWSVYYPQIGSGFKLVAKDTDYVIAIKPETDCDVYNETAAANPLCATFSLQTGDYPYGVLLPEKK
ncbi:Fibronectin type III-like domain [Phytophthora infestans]|uniref:beta-glucosidase n=1 Tax=Phytophthora infestans TaxID=4787 RepID=A0A8S9UJC0_PHYIN|nr:Fibronectin type III-like domain [Phytophthora infestans]